LDFEARLEESAARGAEGVCGFVDEVIREGLRRG
jgi:hypothetical protein